MIGLTESGEVQLNLSLSPPLAEKNKKELIVQARLKAG